MSASWVRRLPQLLALGVAIWTTPVVASVASPSSPTDCCIASRAAPALSAGAQRVAKFGRLWPKASLQKAISRHAGDKATSWVSATGKTIFENPSTGRQVVVDSAGYFRIFQPKAFGSTKGTYLDMLGNVPSPRGVSGATLKSLRQQATHFLFE